MKRRRDRQPREPDPVVFEPLFDRDNGVGASGDDDLFRAVVVGDHGVHAGLLQHLAHRSDIGHNRGHGAGVGRRLGVGRGRFRHQLAAPSRHSQHRRGVERTGGVQGRHLAKTVPCDRCWRDAEGLGQREIGQRCRANRRLRPLGPRQPRSLIFGGFSIESRRREHNLVQPQVRIELEIGREIPRRQRFGPMHRYIGAHREVLAALTREQERHLATVRADAVVNAVGRALRPATAVFHKRHRLFELGGQIGLIDGHEPHTMRGRRVVNPRRLPRQTREYAGSPAARTVQSGTERRDELADVRAAEHDKLVPGHPLAGGVFTGANVLLGRDMKVAAAKAERADARPPRMVRAAHPRPRGRAEGKSPVLKVESRVWPLDLDGWRQHLVVQRHHGLEQPRGPGGSLCVADLRLDRTERAPLLAAAALMLAENQLQALKFSLVAGFGAGAVGLQQLHRVGAEAGLVVRAAQRLGLSAGQRRVHAFGAPVAARPDATQHGIDAIAIPFRVLQPLERDHAQALAQHRAVGLVRERPTVTCRRQRWRLGKAHVHEDVVEHVDAAGHHQIGVAQVQLVHGHRSGGKSARARGVGDTVGARDVEPVGDAPRDDVAQQARKSGFLPRRVVVGDALTRLLHHALGQAGFAHRLDPDRPLQTRDHRSQQLLRRGDAEDDAHPLLVHRRELALARFIEHPLRNDEREQLRGVGGRDDAWRHAPAERIEVHRRQEAAALGVGLIGRLRVGIVEVVDQPVLRRDVGDEVTTGQDVVPEPAFVGRSREQATEANNGDRRLACGGHGDGPRCGVGRLAC